MSVKDHDLVTTETPRTHTLTRTRWLDIARSHWVFISLFAAGTALRGIVILAFQPVLLLQMDAQAYLRRAVELDLSPKVFRPMAYPLLIKPLLAIGGLDLVPLIQHLAGLGVGVLLYVVLLRAGCPHVVAALGAAPALIEGYQLNIEHYILAEAFFELMLVGALVLLLWSAKPSLVAVGSAGALIGLAGLTRYVGVLVIIPALLYLLIRRIGWLQVVTLVAAFVVPLGVYGYWSGQASGDYRVTSKNGFFLYGRVASFADCSEFDPPRRLQRFCFELPPEERPVSRGIWALEPEVIGFNIRRLFGAPEANARLMRFSLMAIKNQPLGYARAVADDLWRFYSPAPPQSKEPNVRTWRFVRSVEEAEPHPFVLKHEGGPPPELGFDDPFRIDGSLAGFLRSYQNIVYGQGLVLLFLTLLGVAGVIAGLGSRMKGERSLRADSFVFTSAALALLLGAVMNTVYHFRYVIPAIPLLGPAAALGMTAIACRVRSRGERAAG